MKAIDIMTTDVVTVSPTTSVYEAARQLLGRRISALPVVDAAGHVVGILSESDLMRRSETRSEKLHPWWRGLVSTDLRQASEFLRSHGRKVADVMTREVVSARASMTIRELAELMEKHLIKRLPVLDGQNLIGIVSRSDMLRALLALGPAEESPPAVDDRDIRQHLLAEFKARHWAGSIISNVIVDTGIVHLWGEASHDQEVEACRALAESIEGVRSISNHMRVVKTVI